MPDFVCFSFLDFLKPKLEKSQNPCHSPAECRFYRSQNEFALAWADLEEAREIAERGEMKLHLADYHLEAGRLESKEQKANSKRQAEERLESKEQKANGKKQTAKSKRKSILP
jgi:hypothetical protein